MNTENVPNVWNLTNDEIKSLVVGTVVTDHLGTRGIYCGTRISGYVVVAWRRPGDTDVQWRQYADTLIKMTQGN